ncbi:MAG: hypothetical protein JNM56_10565 [Planctomycetia bacterium]|nr:hypothetical protein [Planctomycetia bacterium]
MELQVNPHDVILMGENSFVRLSTDGGQTAATRCSHWRVLWTPAGAGHALFVDSPVVNGVRVYADSVPLARFLQSQIEYFLYPAFGDVNLPVLPATFERDGTPPSASHEIVRTEQGEIRLTWTDFLPPFNFAHEPGFDKRPLGVQTSFFPAAAAQVSLAGRQAEGTPWKMDRGGRACTTACLAWCESWFKPR